MTIKRLQLVNFRNFTEVAFDLSDGFSVLMGCNGAGKTNVIEALFVLSTLRSFRVPSLGPLVRQQQQRARAEVSLDDPQEGMPVRLAVTLDLAAGSTRKTATINGKTQRSAAAFYGRLPAILFTPEDLNVLRGSPAARRQLLDRAVFARDRVHIADVRAYEKLVRSRNQVLKDRRAGTAPDDMLDIYDDQLAEVGARIWSRRVELLEDLRPHVHQAFAQIHGTTPCDVEYSPKLPGVAPAARATALHDALGHRRQVDTVRGTTTVGPHHDDFRASLASHPVVEFASQGQTRALMLALKIAELRSTRSRLGRTPLLLLDDVSSELDPQRSAQLFELLQGEVEQTVVTTTDASFIPVSTVANRVDYRIVNGRVERRE
ncbi:MAG: DNA replication/repair protein RecF [Myxococcales bacterium FL481]|nr:MAG: DNA replication/repair protein RecF [Myxococcales bacterium FL481]